jgi:hypothetical protein
LEFIRESFVERGINDGTVLMVENFEISVWKNLEYLKSTKASHTKCGTHG